MLGGDMSWTLDDTEKLNNETKGVPIYFINGFPGGSSTMHAVAERLPVPCYRVCIRWQAGDTVPDVAERLIQVNPSLRC